MKQPSLEILMENVDSKYSLVVVAAKRARQITDAHLEKEELIKPVTQALFEIADHKIQYEAAPTGVK